MARSTALTALLLACLVLSAQAWNPLAGLQSRRLMQVRRLLQGGGWMGGVGTQDMMSENDAAGAIYSAVDNDNFGSTYQATQDGYMDADAATYPDDISGGNWLASGNNY